MENANIQNTQTAQTAHIPHWNVTFFESMTKAAALLADPKSPHKSWTQELLTETGETANKPENIIKAAQRVYDAQARLAMAKEEYSDEHQDGNKLEIIAKFEADLRKECSAWLSAFGVRPERKNPNKTRPFIGVDWAFISMVGECAQWARSKSTVKGKLNLTKVGGFMAVALALETNALITNVPMFRMDDAVYNKACAAAKKEIAEKSAETKGKNQTKLEKTQTKLDETTAELENTQAKLENVRKNILPIIEAVKNSHATDDEKKEIVALLMEL